MRIPDPNYVPPKRLMYGAAAVLVAIMVGVTYYNFEHRGDLPQAGGIGGVSPTGAPPAQTRMASQGVAQEPATTRNVLQTIEHQDQIDLVMRRGWELVDKRDPKSAEVAAEIFREGLRDVDPNNAQFYNGLGRASLVAAKPEDALVAFKKGLAIDPSIADMQSGMGWAYWQLHRPYEAKQAWEAALKIDPKSLDAWSALAWIYLALGENAKAKSGFILLIANDNKDNYAAQGLSMSRSAVRVDVKNVERFFPLPPLETLTTPPATTSAP